MGSFKIQQESAKIVVNMLATVKVALIQLVQWLAHIVFTSIILTVELAKLVTQLCQTAIHAIWWIIIWHALNAPQDMLCLELNVYPALQKYKIVILVTKHMFILTL